MHTVEAGRRIALKNILFATDFSPCSNAALPYSLSVARRHGATLHAAHVMPTKAELVLMSAAKDRCSNFAVRAASRYLNLYLEES
ncbi:MAG: universal stress protein [Terriglobales bacterium]